MHRIPGGDARGKRGHAYPGYSITNGVSVRPKEVQVNFEHPSAL
jgi:hypothetical protein